jgi:hypothetical protein
MQPLKIKKLSEEINKTFTLFHFLMRGLWLNPISSHFYAIREEYH